MSTIKSSDEHLTLNADGSSKDIKFQANGVEKASISSAGAFTSTTIDATKLTGTIPNFTSTGIDDNADATAMTIDSGERIGFPNAPHAWNTVNGSTAIRTLQLGQHTGLVGFDGKSTSLATNAYLSAGQPYNGTWKYVDTYNAQMIIADSGNYYFRSADSGSAGSTISWNERLQITSDGRGLSQFTAKAWINFNGTGTVAIRDSHNVSSIADSGTGNYQVNLTNAMANTNFCVTSSNNDWNATAAAYPATTSQIQVWIENGNQNADTSIIEALVFGD